MNTELNTIINILRKETEIANDTSTFTKPIRNSRPENNDREREIKKDSSAQKIYEDKIHQNYEHIILRSRFANITITNVLNYINGNNPRVYYTDYKESRKFINSINLENHLDNTNEDWKSILKTKLKESKSGNTRFYHKYYKTPAHQIHNLETIVGFIFGDKIYEDIYEKWLKTVIKGNKKNVTLYEIQGVMFILTHKLLLDGPTSLNRNYYLSRQQEISYAHMTSIQKRIQQYMTMLKRKDYQIYNPKYLKKILYVKYKDRKGDLIYMNRFNKDTNERKELLRKIRDKEQEVYMQHLGRKLTLKKISFIHQLLEEKRLITIKRKYGNRNLFELGKCNPFYHIYKNKWIKG